MSHSICIALDILQVAFSYSISFDIQRKENNNKNKWRNKQRNIVVKKDNSVTFPCKYGNNIITWKIGSKKVLIYGMH